MRRAVLEAAPALGMRIAERDLTLEQVLGADELFVTNSLFGVWPIATVDSRRLPVGPVTRRIMGHFGYRDAA
jgi:4-amino-4-deoxychorismate lyase